MATENPITDDLLRSELLRLDVILRKRQAWWEHPRNFALLLGVIAALIGAGAGLLGYKIGSAPPPTINVHLDQPLVR